MKILNFIIIFFIPSLLFASQIKVGKNEKYSSITAAISSANNNDTIILSNEVFDEGNMIINKPVTITGTKNSVVDGRHKTEVFTVKSSHVVISGITIRNSGYSDLKEFAGVRLEHVSSCTISNNYFYDNFFAIYLAGSSFNKISGNRIEGFAKTEA